MGSSFGKRGMGLSSEYGKARGKAGFPSCARQVGQCIGLYFLSRLGDFEPKLGQKLDLAIQEEALKHGDLLVGVFCPSICLCLTICGMWIDF